MKIVIIGLGSMGKRRMRLLHEISVKEQMKIELFCSDAREDRRKEALDLAKELGFCIRVFDSLKVATSTVDDIDAAVISTSPLSHASIIRECLELGLNVFTELNLVKDSYDENISFAKNKGLTLFLSSTPIYREEMKYIISAVHDVSKRLNYTYHVGQYLPDWHPWENYRDFFISNKRTNGCREILAVELPWIVKAFGDIDSIKVMSDKKSELEIDFEDCLNILIRHRTGHTGVFTVDVISRPPVRDMKITGEEIYLSWDGTPYGLKELDNDSEELKTISLYSEIERRKGYNPTIVENMYMNELVDFLSVLKGDKQAEYSFEQDKAILDVIDEIEGLM